MVQLTKEERSRYAAMGTDEFKRTKRQICFVCNELMLPDFLDNTRIDVYDKKTDTRTQKEVRGVRGFFCINCTNCETI